jgi:hypothetical protein
MTESRTTLRVPEVKFDDPALMGWWPAELD